MSATFFLKFRGQYVLLTFQTGKTIASLVERKKATPFISEADAWIAAAQHHLKPEEFVEVVSAADSCQPSAVSLKEAA